VADRLLVSTTKGLFSFDRGSSGWNLGRTSFLGEKVSLTLPDPRDGGWYAALNLGHFGVKLKFSPDQGKTWEDRAVPAYPEGATFSSFDGKPPQPATLKGIWALECQGTNKPGHLWAGTAPGGLFRSSDGGRSWSLVRGLWDRPQRSKWFGGGTEVPALHSICVDPRDSKTIHIAVSCGGVAKTTDDGETWESTSDGMFAEFMPPELQRDPDIQDPHMMVQCPGDPDYLWVQHHNGIFRTRNGGQKWEVIPDAKPSVFGFGVAVHPKDGNAAWFVPAIKDERRVPVDGRFVVSRTRDGGKTFEVLTNGLPRENAYDLVYRHALAIDDTGNRLAIGSTTGGLWVSENQGDRWLQVPARLPPVQAVRFA
jgi:photosystem II stability/assembly factor-like uncharacterized protein